MEDDSPGASPASGAEPRAAAADVSMTSPSLLQQQLAHNVSTCTDSLILPKMDRVELKNVQAACLSKVFNKVEDLKNWAWVSDFGNSIRRLILETIRRIRRIRRSIPQFSTALGSKTLVMHWVTVVANAIRMQKDKNCNTWTWGA